MRYEQPEVVDLGAVEELTFGGAWFSDIDWWTGYYGPDNQGLQPEQDQPAS